MTEPVGCARPTGVVVGSQPEEAEPEFISPEKEKKKMAASVGKKAPDFTAPAYYQGEFTEVTLSDYLKKWVLLCFYPGDFTFV